MKNKIDLPKPTTSIDSAIAYPITRRKPGSASSMCPTVWVTVESGFSMTQQVPSARCPHNATQFHVVQFRSKIQIKITYARRPTRCGCKTTSQKPKVSAGIDFSITLKRHKSAANCDPYYATQ